MGLEGITVFLTELGFGFLDPVKEGCARDADDIGDVAVGTTVKAELSDLTGFRHKLVQALEQLLKNDAVSYDAIEVGGLVLMGVAHNLLLVLEG